MAPTDRSSSSQDPSESSDQEMNVFLKVSKTVAFNVKKSDTVKNLKAMVCDKEGVSEYFPDIFYGGERLKDEHKLVDCGIQKNSTLHIVLNSGAVKLFVYIPSMTKTSEIVARGNDSIQNIKSLIKAREGIRTDRFTLFHAGVLLEDFRTLNSLGIKGGSTLQLIFDPKDDVSISVKLVSGEVVKINVKLLYTVADVKAIIGSISAGVVNAQNLVYLGKQLDDSKTLAFYKVVAESNLRMVFGDIRIYVQHHGGKIIWVDVRLSDIVKDVRNKIFGELGIPIDSEYHDLMFAGKVLESDKDLASYGIEKRSTLYVCERTLKVCIVMPLRKNNFEYDEVGVFDTIRKIKVLMRVRDEIQEDLYMFHYGGNLLEDVDSITFASLGIKNREVTLVITPKPTSLVYSINVETETGMLVKTKVSSLYTIDLVIFVVANVAGIFVGEDQSLIYQGSKLVASRTLGSYKINNASVVKMRMTGTQKPNPSISWNIQIFVKPWTGKTLSLLVGRYDTAGSVKTKIFSKLGIRGKGKYYLSFCGKSLEDDKNLATYGIEKDNTIHVNCRNASRLA